MDLKMTLSWLSMAYGAMQWFGVISTFRLTVEKRRSIFSHRVFFYSLREKYGITDDMVLPFEVIPIINIPGV